MKHIRKIVHAGHIFHKGKPTKLEEKLKKTFTPPCEHGSYCNKLAGLPKAHCSEDYMNGCGNVKKYYDKYKDMYNQLGVGS